MPTARAAWLGALIVLAAATLFGSLGVASRFAYDAGVQPFAFVAWRAGVGALGIILVVSVLRGLRELLAEGLQPLQAVGGATILAAALLVQRGTRVSSETGGVVVPAPGGP